MLKNRIEL